MENILFYLGLFTAGTLSGFVNMISGGGSIINMSFMMLCGIDPTVANATNRVGVLISCGTGVMTFKKEKYKDMKTGLKLGLWAIPGAVLGAIFSVKIGSECIEYLLTAAMILLIISLFIPKKSYANSKHFFNGKILYPSMLIVGLYGGFVQVGVGVLISSALRHFAKMDLIKMSMHRVIIVFVFVIPVLVVFILSGKINWIYALILSAGNALGSHLTVKYAFKKGDKIIKIGLVITVCLLIAKLLIFK